MGEMCGGSRIWRTKMAVASFFIPYFTMLFVCGIPIFMAELALGQYSAEGTLTVWKCLPAFKGIGFGMVICSFLVMIYYNIVIAYSLHYLFSGFAKILPWKKCDQWWNSVETRADCIIQRSELSAAQRNCVNWNSTEEQFWKMNDTITTSWRETFSNATVYPDFTNLNYTTLFMNGSKTEPAQEYWFRRVLRLHTEETDSGDELYTMDNLGGVLWDLIGCNAAAWLLVFFCLFKGVQSSGKVVYFTATFPYFVLLILVIFGATLDGAKDGIEFYLKPDMSKLSDGDVWATAATQIFYSLGVSFGGLMTMASYNEFNNNILRDTMIVSLGNCFSSVFAGFGVFSFLGHMAKRNCMAIEDVVASGPGLAFIAYPEAIGLLPAEQLFSALFFIMLVLLGIDSQFAMTDVLIAAVLDTYPHIFRRGHRKTMVVGFFLSAWFSAWISNFDKWGL